MVYEKTDPFEGAGLIFRSFGTFADTDSAPSDEPMETAGGASRVGLEVDRHGTPVGSGQLRGAVLHDVGHQGAEFVAVGQ